MQNIDIAIEDTRWTSVDFEALAIRAVAATLTYLNIDVDAAEASILACDDIRIAVLNTEFRDKPTPTNVLSWPSEERAAGRAGGLPEAVTPGHDGLIELGDIAISYDTCAREADSAAKPIAEHITHLIIHATLHLLGFDHENEPDAALMEGLEVKILGNLGLDDPYRNQ